jgi:4-hydroxy-2-oxoheptanedioate aldolase
MAVSLRSRALAGETLLGCFLTWPVGGVAEILGLAGLDFIVLDTEHGFFSIESVETMVRACDVANLPAVVRVPSSTAAEVGRCLDAGAAGTLFPRADGLPAVRGSIELAKFPPTGRRGLGGARANKYGTVPLDRFVVEANDATLVAVQIETAGALAEVAAIAREPQVDILYVGPNDLTQALGIPGKSADPRYQAEITRVAAAAKKAGKAAGIMLARTDQIPALREKGYTFFTMADRTLFLESARRWRQELKADS